MFDALSERLGGIFDNLTGRGALSDKDVSEALREIRVALLEADVALPVVKDFIAKVKTRAVGEEVIRSVKPGQQVIKIVYDGLVDMLGGEDADTSLRIDSPPAVVMMAGLQGSGKTTTTGKLAKRLSEKGRKKVLLASLDVRRPAAMEQLAILADQCGDAVSSLPIIQGQLPADIARRALNAAKIGGYDVLFLDTAGRTSIDEQMMTEAAEIAEIAQPQETLLVADALTGQDAVETARRFHERLPLTGLVLTRMDGDGRGGAALSMRAVTGLPIKFLGVGEKLDGLDTFDAQRVAGRILGQGDIVSLVEKASEQMDAAKAERMAEKMRKGIFDLNDLAEQLKQMQQMGGLGGLMGMLPGARKAKQAMEAANLDDNVLKRQEAIISSMTKAERAKPALLNASRRKRIAAGSGTTVQDVNKLLKMHQQMAGMMKKMRTKGGMKNMLGMAQQAGISQADLAKMGGQQLPGLGGGSLPPGMGDLLGGKKK
ncbi:signal recognition particle protein [Hyphomonas adhaerens]|uniref:signal recognition particle protein n=1 Tax=Hyphomonas adhaerens TaxID=81029 RepID=UPI00235254D1|nr:signal recognition particle protein [Hyphomonas adhaerens]|tara:strand:+ start:23200 stop:24657 length:1458 start_codon:yes stop_codon:yes gene_type:complete